MRPLELGALYLLVGAGCAAALLVGARRAEAAAMGASGRIADAALLVFLWPLWGPFRLMQRQDSLHAQSPESTDLAHGPPDAASRSEVAFLVALRRARQGPLASLLPDEPTVKALGRRVRVAAGKVAEIDALLGRPELSEQAALARLRELGGRGSETAQATARVRLANIRRLGALRDRFARELDEVRELQAQLLTQAEVVRLAGSSATLDPGTADLVSELVGRVTGLDQVLDDDLGMGDNA